VTLLVELGVASQLEQAVQAAMNFTPIGESGKQKLREKIAPSRSAWVDFLRTNEDSLAVGERSNS